MKTDKLFYRIFLSQPSLIAELLSDIPDDCEFEYSAPVIKEKEIRLNGLLTPVGDHPNLPIIFLEAQMQRDSEFYSRYFAGLFLYLHQYKVKRTWRGLLILNTRNQDLGSEVTYQALLNTQVQRLYLQDLLTQENLSPNLALLKLIVTPETEALNQAQQILNSAETETEFRLKLDLIEAILINKFPKLTIGEIQKMLNLREADVTQTRFYQEVLQIGRSEGEQQGESVVILKLLKNRLGSLSLDIQQQIRNLPTAKLDQLSDRLLDFNSENELREWITNNLS